MFEDDDEVSVTAGPAIALAKWKEQTGGKKPQPTDIEQARKKWMAEGCPKEGTFYPSYLSGNWYVFAPNGDHLLKESFEKNFPRS
jgi:hypothetical protein